MAGNLRRISLYLLSGFYVFAGMNHFINPNFYFPLIPDYLPYHEYINWISGALEMLFGAMLLSSKSRKAAAWGIVMLLLLFIPSHVHFIQIGSCVEDGLCVPPWLGWARLILIHPLLIGWALMHRK